ncbi:hypothetical protein BTM25_44400 [Actinomadura rubteroloni]|uniref:Uncharacterized protein n=1 Tax=Actinomadura rubteroloni TaxID=1926885 RepID=A0A2P4UE06_9ACTN|nr:DUF5691 domain-containing protein [Actinomadura rubteroloni]POM23287.1 hypothetical protein BTM25_44400 [Actinomadura rubteroloni]
MWDEHVGAALLGTARRVPPVLAGAPAGGDPAGRLLDQAAVLAVRRRAGVRPGRGGVDPVAPAPAEELPVVPADAADRLDDLLAGRRTALLPEWLRLAAARGLRAPARAVPHLLDLGRERAHRDLRGDLAAVVGRRGVWLALQNPRWAYVIALAADPGTDDPGVWSTGTREQRVAHLARSRRADPDRARAELAAVWRGERAPDRAEFAAALATGLSAADEEFLEAALDDRAGEVRATAAALLAQLPGSALGARMAVRARGCVRPERRTLRGRAQTWIAVTPPAEHDEGMARDGVPFHPEGSFAPGRTPAPQQAWLREILARTPLATWPDVFALPPAEILALPVTSGAEPGRGARDVHLGLARAALWQRDAVWARALLDGGVLLDAPAVLADLAGVLPPAERAGAAAGLVRWIADPKVLAEQVLARLPSPWTGDLAATVAGTIATLLDRPAGTANTALRALARDAGHRLDPALADRYADRFAGLGTPETVTVRDALVATLRYRHAMVKELHP